MSRLATEPILRGRLAAYAQGDSLFLRIERSSQPGEASGDEVDGITARFPGPFRSLVIDLGNCPRLTSLLASRLLRIRDFYRHRDTHRFLLDNLQPAVVEVIHLLRLDRCFDLA